MAKHPLKNLFFVLPLIPFLLYGQDSGKWVRCSGEAAIQNITSEEAQVIAKRQARLDAIEKVCGVSMHAETLVKDFVAAGDFVHAMSFGRVVEEKDFQWKTETLPPLMPGSPPVLVLRVEMTAKVVPEAGNPDPSFKVELKLNRTTFQSGEEVILKIKATKECFVTVLNLGADDSVRVLFPNKWQPDIQLNANSTMEIPESSLRDSGVYHIRVANLPGHKRDGEMVKVIATRRRIDLSAQTEAPSGFGLMGTPKMAMTSLAKWLSEIPVSERTEAAVSYVVESP
jgi:hypothetical protein